MYRENSNNNESKGQPRTDDLPRQPANQELRWLELKVLSLQEISKFKENKQTNKQTKTNKNK